MQVNHIAFILDGNGRWAKERGLPITEGHKAGLVQLEKILDFCFDRKIRTVTVYAFSSENWKRADEEKAILFDLLLYYFKHKIAKVIDRKTKVKVIGNTSLFSKKIQETIKATEDLSAENDAFLFQIALSYGGRDEIIRAVKKVALKLEEKELSLPALNEANFKLFLDTGEVEDPDLLIRTGGEVRLSNFLLYQLAYTELFFTKTLWPDFSSAELDNILSSFNKRERRFGGRK